MKEDREDTANCSALSVQLMQKRPEIEKVEEPEGKTALKDKQRRADEHKQTSNVQSAT